MSTRVLVVDDHEAVRHVIAEILEMHGFEVFQACDGASGLDMTRELCPDLVLSDYYMPALSGLDLLNSIRHDEETANVPFILMSMERASWLKEQAIRQGANEFLLKPFDVKELLAAVAAFTGSKRLALRPTC